MAGEEVKKIAQRLNVGAASHDQYVWERLSLPNGYIRRERPSTPSAHMALTRPVVPPDGSFISAAFLSEAAPVRKDQGTLQIQ